MTCPSLVTVLTQGPKSKGDIVRLIMSHAKESKKLCRYLVLYSPGSSMRREVGPGMHFGLPFWGREGRKWVSQ